jgi:hypothetical protein
VDHNGKFFGLSFYNVGTNFIDTIELTKTNITVIDPILKTISFTVNGKVYEYPCVQITNLSKVLVNGKPCSNFESHSLLISKFFN